MAVGTRCHFSVLLLVVALVAPAAWGQIISLGNCHSYQTTESFDQYYIDNLATAEHGFILALSTGGTEHCQRLKFNNDTSFTYSFIDIANFPQEHSDLYNVEVGTITRPAQLSLRLPPRVLGSNMIGNLAFFPLIASEDYFVVASCHQIGLLKEEQLMVFVQYNSTTAPAAVDLKELLFNTSIPQADELKEVSQNCVPGVRHAPQPIPLRLYNIISRLQNTPTVVPAPVVSYPVPPSQGRPAVVPIGPSFRSGYHGPVIDDEAATGRYYQGFGGQAYPGTISYYEPGYRPGYPVVPAYSRTYGYGGGILI